MYMHFQSTLLVFFSMYNKADFKATSKFWKEKKKRLFTLLLLQGANVLDKQCMTEVLIAWANEQKGISWFKRVTQVLYLTKAMYKLHWKRCQKSHADDSSKQINNATYTTNSYLLS